MEGGEKRVYKLCKGLSNKVVIINGGAYCRI